MELENYKLGECFNAYTGEFIPKQFFKQAPVPSIEQAHKYDYRYEDKQNSKQLNELMDISGELSITIMSFPLSLSGKAKYFKDTKKHYDSQYAKVHY